MARGVGTTGRGRTVNADERQPWSRQNAESPKAFAAFEIYLSQGPGRSLSRAWAEYQRQIGGKTAAGKKPSGFFFAWSSQHRWVERVAAWGAAQAEENRATQRREWAEWSHDFARRQQRQLEALNQLSQGAFHLAARGLIDRLALQPSQPMTVGELARLLRAAALLSDTSANAETALHSLDRVLAWYDQQAAD